jgi:arylsulfatase A-like enzyme
MRPFALPLALPLAALLAAPAAARDLGYDLRANLPAAHVYRGGAVADAATVGFVKYIRDMNGSWKLGAKEDGAPAAYLPGLQANLWLPVGPEQKGAKLALEARFKPIGKDQRVDVFVDGKKIGSPNLTEGWQTVRVNVPDAVSPGLVKVRLHFRRSTEYAGTKTAAAIRYVRLTPQDAPPAPATEADVAAALRSDEGDALVLPDGAGLDYYVTPVKGLTLSGTARGGEVEVFAQTDGAAPKKLGGGASLALKLDAYAGKAVRLMLRGKGGAVKLDGAKLAGGAAGAPATPTKPKYVVVWLIDTLRADKLDFYPIPNANGRKKVKTPHLSALAKESTIFTPYWVQGNESKASHASLFTGTYPARHGVYTHEAKLEDGLVTIAEAFKKAGYRTGGFVSNGYVSDRWNFDQGFQDFQNFIREGKGHNARAVIKAALPWIDKNKDKPFYLYLGTSDPHVTYRAHKDFIDQYDEPGYAGSYKKYLSGTELGKLKAKKSPPAERERKRIEALYENEIAFNDHHFGKLVEHLKAAGIYDETMIVVTSDHGDEFWERGSCGHGHNLNQELINVPFFVRYPPLFPKGKLATEGAGGVDVLPTLMGVLGQKPAEAVQGIDLLPYVWAEGAVYPTSVMASMGTGSFALQTGPAKVIMRSERAIEIYDTAKDPAEKDDQFEKRVVLTLAAMDPLSLFLTRPKTWRKSVYGPPNNLTRAFE